MGRSTRTRIFSDEELKKFFAVFKLSKESDWYYYHVFRIQYLTALRISDMMRIRKEDVKYKHFIIREKKTKRKRMVYLCDEAFQLAQNLARVSKQEFLLTKKDDSSYRRAIKIYCKRAKVNPEKISTHSLRKTIANKVAILKRYKVASKLLNHKRLETTEYYLDNSQESLESAINVLSES